MTEMFQRLDLLAQNADSPEYLYYLAQFLTFRDFLIIILNRKKGQALCLQNHRKTFIFGNGDLNSSLSRPPPKKGPFIQETHFAPTAYQEITEGITRTTSRDSPRDPHAGAVRLPCTDAKSRLEA